MLLLYVHGKQLFSCRDIKMPFSNNFIKKLKNLKEGTIQTKFHSELLLLSRSYRMAGRNVYDVTLLYSEKLLRKGPH